MRTLRRATPALALVAVAAVAPLTHAAGVAQIADAGQLAFVAASGDLDLVTVMADGTTTDPTRIGPVTTVAAPNTVKVSDPVVSDDGSLLAWSEVISKPDPRYGPQETAGVLVVHNLSSGDNVTLRSEAYPLGFAGHTLVTVGAHTARFVTTPSPHLVRIRDGGAYAVATYPKGIVDVLSGVGGRNDTIETDRLRLVTFAGHAKVIHTYRVGTTYRSAAANIDAVSPDGHKLVIELGNHQDFEGLGPSSNYDTYRLDQPGDPRRQLGHYGTNAADWRLQNATFAGADDTPWLALHSGYEKVAGNYAVRGVVVADIGGKWQLKKSGAIAVAGNPLGYVAVQPGEWRAVKNSPVGEFDPVPTASAVLFGLDGATQVMPSVEGTALVWIP